MLYRDPPNADAALFAYLVSVLFGVVAFALLGLWLTQPTVIANGGLAAFEKERRTPSPLVLALRAPDTDSKQLDPEQSAVKLAEQENEKQGLRSVAFSNQVAPPAPSSKVVDAAPRPKANPQAKRVAKVQRRDDGRDLRNDPRNDPRSAWAYAPAGARGPFGGGFGGFGSWFR